MAEELPLKIFRKSEDREKQCGLDVGKLSISPRRQMWVSDHTRGWGCKTSTIPEGLHKEREVVGTGS